MKQQNAFARSALALSVLGLVSACGGGGGSVTPPPAPVQIAQTAFGQAEATPLAGVGFLTSELMLTQKQTEHSYFGGFLKGFVNSSTGGSSPAFTGSCITATGGSGSFTGSVTKAGAYAGLNSGDQINITYAACNFGGGALTLNGSSVITAGGNYPSLSSNSAVLFSVRSTNFDMTLGTQKVRTSGTESVKFDATAAGDRFPLITTDSAIGTAISYFSTSTSVAPSLIYTAASPVRMVSSTTSTSSFISSLDGSLSVSNGGVVIPLAFATQTPLTGNVVGGRPTPTVGTLRVKDTGANHLTETTIQGLSAVLKADTNGDGVLDTSYNTTYVALTTF